MLSKFIAITGLAMGASAHIIMSNPVPYGKSSLNNSPLDASGADFPCKQRLGVYDADGASNVYAQGSTQQLSFVGTAVHGGGSCQVSVTTDAKPDKNSVWKVIKSIEGGCPAKGQPGNMGDDANAVDPYKYDFIIPTELASGNYTLAWTWANKQGNRELYMNCAPMTVTGSGGSEGFLNTLPNMFVANIGNGCTVPEDKDVLYPNPGKDVDKFNGATDAFAAPTGPGCGAQSGSPPSPTTAPGGPAPTTAPGSAPTIASPGEPSQAPSGTADQSIPGGVFITSPVGSMSHLQPAATSAPVASAPAESTPVASAPAESTPIASVSAPSATDPAATSAPAASAPVESTPVASETPAPTGSTAPAPSSGSDSGSGSKFAAGTACTIEGQWNCIDGSTFQRCASGSWSSVQPLSAGMKCTVGQASELKTSAKKFRRSMRSKQQRDRPCLSCIKKNSKR